MSAPPQLPPSRPPPSQALPVVARALGATLLVQALVSVVSFTVPVIAPLAADDVGVDRNALGVYASLLYLGAMAASLTCGGFIRRFGAIRFSQGALALCALGMSLATGASWILLIVSALVAGIGYGPITPASSHILARHTPPRLMALVFSVKQTGVPLGGMIAGLLVPFLAVEFGWRGAGWGVGLICLAGALLVQPIQREFDVDLSPDEPLLRGNIVGPLKLVLFSPVLRRLAFASLAFSAMQMCFAFFLVVFLMSSRGVDIQTAGLALSVAQVGGIIGRVLWGGVADRVGDSRWVLAGLAFAMSLGAVALAFYPAGWPFWLLVALAALLGVTAIGWNGVFLAEVSRVAPEGEVGRATGGALFITYFGVVAGPPAFGALATLTGSYVAGFLVLSAVTGYFGILLAGARK